MYIEEYQVFKDAYDYFNQKLFDNKLPPAFFTFQRKSRSLGFCHYNQFSSRLDKERLTELAMNPDGFVDRSDIEIWSTLCHEMCHIFECYFIEPPRKAYHTAEWAEVMEKIGLMPSSTGEVGGKKTGQHMTHYIIEGGKFEIAAGAFILKHKIVFQSTPLEEKEKKEKKPSRQKYSCSGMCGTSVWAKHELNIICGDCNLPFVPDDAEGEK